MSFILKKIELHNIRIHEHFVFEPALDGVTAISGDNGSGKSTIVDSLAWVLYGTRVNNMRNKTLIKEGVDPKLKPVKATVTLVSGGIEYIIERKITTENGGVECNVWGRIDNKGDLTQIAGPAVSHVEKFIRQTLNLDEKGFLTSILIQQKQVDQIVAASPRERGEVIEKMTGISSITKAIQMANEETRSLQRAANIIHKGDIDEAKAKFVKQEELCKSLIKEETALGEKFKTTKELYKTQGEEYKVELERQQKTDSINSEISTLKSNNKLLTRQAENDLEYIASHKKKYGSVATSDIKDVAKRLDASRKGISDLSSSIKFVNKSIEQSEATAASLNEVATKDIDSSHSKLKEVQDLIENLKNEIDTTNENAREIASDLKRSKTSLKQVDNGETHCPVCKAEITDPEELKLEIESEIKELTAKGKELTKEIKSLREKLAEQEAICSDLMTSIEAYNKLAEVNKVIEEETAKRNTMNDELSKLMLDLKSIESEYEACLKIEADRERLEAAKARSLTVTSEVEENAKRITELTTELETINALGKRDFNKLERETQKLQQEVTTLAMKGREIQGKRSLAQERLNDYKERCEIIQTALDQYNSIAEQIQIASTSAGVMSDFKRARIEYSIPTLEYYASDILTKFTGGAFTKLSLDEKFNTSVTTAQGTVRPITQLSGGELSAAAVALRLGISLMLNANDRNVLILDEVLVSMDEDRARQIMETISSMTNCQVIFIAHNTEINSVADKTVYVERK